MTALKGAEIERFVRSPDTDALVVLVYGPDTGLVSERARALVKALLAGSDDPFALAELDPTAIAEPGRLVDEASMLPPFGGPRIVHVRRGDGIRPAAVSALLDTDLTGAQVVIEDGDLKRDSALRKLCERHKRARALPCYADGAGDIDGLIDQAFKAFDLRIEPDARRAMKDLLGGDRLASRMELEKLCLYALNDGVVTLDHIDAVSGDAGLLDTSDFVDAVGLGEVADADRHLGRLLQSGMHPVQLIGALQRHLALLRVIRSAVDDGQTIESALKSIRPPIFFRREGHVRQQALRWTLSALRRARDTLSAADLDGRKQSELADIILGRAVLSLSTEGRRLGRGMRG
ncbi:MAG: DNA polymerase III subunit delta [Pseudomonadota bacterium]